VLQSARDLGLSPYVRCLKGWFDETLPAHRERIGPIALLRIDADWYESVQCCLENLYDQVAAGGFVVFDDYYTYDGCAIAVHEFLGRRRLSHRIESELGAAPGMPATFRKGNQTWHGTWQSMTWTDKLQSALRDLTTFVPPGEPLILVDEEQLRPTLDPRWRAIPFLEREGQYWGPPPDDATGIRELERLRQAGARYIAFAWPAFWWLDCYLGLHGHLRSRFPCLLENDRLVVFGLRPSAGGAGARETTDPCPLNTKGD
jgi:hypothetical protein